MNIFGIILGAAIILLCLVVLGYVANSKDGHPMSCDGNCISCSETTCTNPNKKKENKDEL